MQATKTPSGPGTHPNNLMSIMANGHQLQIDLEKVKGQLMDILKDHPISGRDLTQYHMTPSRIQQSPRGPGLGMSGVRLQSRYNQKLVNRRRPSSRDYGSPYSVSTRSEHAVPNTHTDPGTPSHQTRPMRTNKRTMLTPKSEGIISNAVHNTVLSHAFPKVTPEGASPRRVLKRRTSPLTYEHRREYMRVKRARRSSSVQQVQSPSNALSESVSLSQDDIDHSTDVDTFPIMFPKTCSPKEAPKRKSSDATKYKTIHDISSISRSSKTNLREHLSGSESVLQTGNALHSTFNYPLHSTMNYPLHSTMTNAVHDINLEMTLKMSEGHSSRVQSLAGSEKKCGSSKDSTCECTECLEEDSELAAKVASRKPSTAAFGDYVTQLEGLAARLISPGDHMRRQTGQLQLSNPKTPVELSESTFCSDTMPNNSSMDATKGSAPEIDVDVEPSAQDLLRERLHIGGLVRTPLTRTSAGRLAPEGCEVPRRPQHVATPFPVYQQTVVQTKVSQRLVSRQIQPEHFYESLTPKTTPAGHPDYENIPVRRSVVAKRRRSNKDKENDAPPALPPRCPTRTPSSMTRPRLPVPACFTEMDSVLSARPGCFNLLKSSVKKRKDRAQDVNVYNTEKRRQLAEKMMMFQRSISNVKVNEREQEVTMLGHL